jgi:hypothetical protein
MKTPFRFDGHGINDANGQRICKVSCCEPYIYPNGTPVRNPEFDALSNLFAAAPEMLEVLEAVAARWDKYDEQDAPELGATIQAAIDKTKAR